MSKLSLWIAGGSENKSIIAFYNKIILLQSDNWECPWLGQLPWLFVSLVWLHKYIKIELELLGCCVPIHWSRLQGWDGVPKVGLGGLALSGSRLNRHEIRFFARDQLTLRTKLRLSVVWLILRLSGETRMRNCLFSILLVWVVWPWTRAADYNIKA